MPRFIWPCYTNHHGDCGCMYVCESERASAASRRRRDSHYVHYAFDLRCMSVLEREREREGKCNLLISLAINFISCAVGCGGKEIFIWSYCSSLAVRARFGLTTG